MTRTIVLALGLLALSLSARPAAAQTVIVVEGALTLATPYTSPGAAPAPVAPQPEAARAPRWRLDFGTPAVGIGGFYAPAADYARTVVSLSFDVRLVGMHGHGAMARFVTAGNVWGAGHGLELDYLHRVRLAGDDRFGLGLDALIGLSFGGLSHNESTVPRGLVAGGNGSLQLDLRLYGFVISLGVVYRGLFPTEGAPNGGPTGFEHAVTGTLGLGFGFWG